MRRLILWAALAAAALLGGCGSTPRGDWAHTVPQPPEKSGEVTDWQDRLAPTELSHDEMAQVTQLLGSSSVNFGLKSGATHGWVQGDNSGAWKVIAAPYVLKAPQRMSFYGHSGQQVVTTCAKLELTSRVAARDGQYTFCWTPGLASYPFYAWSRVKNPERVARPMKILPPVEKKSSPPTQKAPPKTKKPEAPKAAPETGAAGQPKQKVPPAGPKAPPAEQKGPPPAAPAGTKQNGSSGKGKSASTPLQLRPGLNPDPVKQQDAPADLPRVILSSPYGQQA